MTGYTVERFSKRQIVRAGKLIRGQHTEPTDELIEAFKTAHKWRDAHVYPMRGIRTELARLSRKVESDAITAGRLKRMSSIRRKLKPGNRSLYQIQDISGCRAIMRSMDSVREVQRLYLDGNSRHEVSGQDDYIAAPKPDGYRSHHLILKFDGSEEQTGGNRLVVEVQLRSRLQHAWATTVEAVGFVRKENLKGGEGSREWLRLFQLMSGEIACTEGCPVPSSCPESEAERRAELRELEVRLEAIKTLESYNQAIRHAEEFLSLRGNSYLIRYDMDSHRVSVSTFSQFRSAAVQYFNAEMFSAESENAVLVEVDRVEDLRDAYPNYFLDVTKFTSLLRTAVLSAFAAQRPGPPQVPASKWASVLHWMRNT
jgi:ppGpp synthetase/RelA/SpoT-type nucleotidyltranferase